MCEVVTTIHNQHSNGDLRPMCSIWVAKQHARDAGYSKTIVRMYEGDKLISREDYNLVKS